MGGVNETMKEFVEYKPEAGTIPPAGYAATEKIHQQGMSGPADQSASHLYRQLKGAGQEFYTNSKKLIDSAASMASPNFFGRQTSSAPTADTQNK